MVDWFGYFITILRLFVFLYFCILVLFWAFYTIRLQSRLEKVALVVLERVYLQRKHWSRYYDYRRFYIQVFSSWYRSLWGRYWRWEEILAKFTFLNLQGELVALMNGARSPPSLHQEWSDYRYLSSFLLFLLTIGDFVLFFSSNCRCCYNLEPITANIVQKLHKPSTNKLSS